MNVDQWLVRISRQFRGHDPKKPYMQTGCGQEEPGNVMHVKLVTGICPAESPVIAYNKARSKVPPTQKVGGPLF